MATVQISVSETMAEQYQRLTQQQKTILSALITDSLSKPADLLEAMDYISFKAERRGLTEEILINLLAD